MGFPCPMHGLEPWAFGCSYPLSRETLRIRLVRYLLLPCARHSFRSNCVLSPLTGRGLYFSTPKRARNENPSRFNGILSIIF